MAKKGKVVGILDEFRILISLGKIDKVKLGDRFIVYTDLDDIKDPDTGKSLGRLTLTKGRVKVIQIEERFSIAISDSFISSDLFPNLGIFKNTRERLPVNEKQVDQKYKKHQTINIGDPIRQLEEVMS